MQLNFAICLVLSLTSWWQQTLRKTCGLRCQDGVLVSDCFAFKKSKSYRQQALGVEVEVGYLSAFVNEWWGINRE